MLKKYIRNLITTGLLIITIFSPPLWAAAKNIIYIYQDKGVSQESFTHTVDRFKNSLNSLYNIKPINAEEIKQGKWQKEAALFIMPGGADLPYVKKLKGLGNEQIKQYVKNGGSFLGICAGAYYASSYVEFDKNGPLEVLGNRELGFFPGKSVGPILAPYDYKTQSGSRAARISTIFNEVPEAIVYYNGGGFFENAQKYPNIKVIASYSNKLPAIIAIAYGKGQVVLSGVHFEYNPALLDSKDPYSQKLLKPLEDSNQARNLLFYQLLSILKLKIT